MPLRLLLVASFVLCACATQEEIDEEIQQDAQIAREREQSYMQRTSDRCYQFGFKAGTPEHAQCMLSIDQQNRAVDGAVLNGVAAEAMRQEAVEERRRAYRPR